MVQVLIYAIHLVIEDSQPTSNHNNPTNNQPPTQQAPITNKDIEILQNPLPNHGQQATNKVSYHNVQPPYNNMVSMIATTTRHQYQAQLT